MSIKRLLANLIENALRYGGNGVEVAAFVAGDHTAPYVVLSVLDRGQGIDPAELGDIFNPFIRGDRARGGKGTGLGLAIVKRIAALHGGSVELRNRSGGGLEARVCLPGPAAAPRRRLTGPARRARVQPRRLPSGCDAGLLLHSVTLPLTHVL